MLGRDTGRRCVLLLSLSEGQARPHIFICSHIKSKVVTVCLCCLCCLVAQGWLSAGARSLQHLTRTVRARVSACQFSATPFGCPRGRYATASVPAFASSPYSHCRKEGHHRSSRRRCLSRPVPCLSSCCRYRRSGARRGPCPASPSWEVPCRPGSTAAVEGASWCPAGCDGPRHTRNSVSQNKVGDEGLLDMALVHGATDCMCQCAEGGRSRQAHRPVVTRAGVLTSQPRRSR